MTTETEMIRVTTPACMLCGKPSVLMMEASGCRKLLAGEFIQDAFPDMSVNDRELFISGTHPECWDAIYSEEDN